MSGISPTVLTTISLSDSISLSDMLDYNISDSDNDTLQPAVIGKLTYRNIQDICYRMIMPGVLGFGIVGNVLNIFILCQQRFQRSMDKMERCATMGFIFLAVSDLAFCIFGFPSAFVRQRMFANTKKSSEVFELLYMLYRPGILNVFLLSSTWCVVLIAIERYLVVTHPMKARSSVRLRRTVILQVVIPVASVMVNIPHFLKYNIHYMTTPDNSTLLVPAIREFAHVKSFRNMYTVIWNIFGTLIPVMALIFCNIQLIRAIYHSRMLGLVNVDKYSTSRITFILVAIIILYIVLVCPSTILNFIKEVYIGSNQQESYNFPSAIVITNILQASNFAVNFILYFGMNPKFRANMRFRMVSCSSPGANRRQIKKQFKQYELVHIKPQPDGAYPPKEICCQAAMAPV